MDLAKNVIMEAVQQASRPNKEISWSRSKHNTHVALAAFLFFFSPLIGTCARVRESEGGGGNTKREGPCGIRWIPRQRKDHAG